MKTIALHSAVAIALACGGFLCAGNARSLATAFDTTPTPTPTTATTTVTTTAPTTTATTTTPTLTQNSGPGHPLTSLSKPTPGGTRVSRSPLTYQVKAGKPVTWWLSVSSTGIFTYGINVFNGPTGTNQVAGSAVFSSLHQKHVQKSWTWRKPPRGVYRVCAAAASFSGDAASCQIVRVGPATVRANNPTPVTPPKTTTTTTTTTAPALKTACNRAFGTPTATDPQVSLSFPATIKASKPVTLWYSSSTRQDLSAGVWNVALGAVPLGKASDVLFFATALPTQDDQHRIFNHLRAPADFFRPGVYLIGVQVGAAGQGNTLCKLLTVIP